MTCAGLANLQTTGIEGQWENALTTVVLHPMAGVRRALCHLLAATAAEVALPSSLFRGKWVFRLGPGWADVPVPHPQCRICEGHSTDTGDAIHTIPGHLSE